MIKTRFGETLPSDSIIPTMRIVQPFETSARHLRTISDLAGYKKVHGTLNAIVLAALKTRVRAGEVDAIRAVWAARDKTFLTMNFAWSERNEKSCLEFGYATMRCGHLDALGVWPPIPESNYRKGHYIVSEYVDKVFNKHVPTYPWQYAFGDSQIVLKAKLPVIVQSIFSSLVGPDSETTSNSLVLVGHGIYSELHKLEEMKIKLPNNVLIIDTTSFERALFTAGARGPMPDRAPGTSMSLATLLATLPQKRNRPIPDVQAHNSGNDAFMSLLALQILLDPETKVPDVKKPVNTRMPNMTLNLAGNGAMGMGMVGYPAPYMSMPNMTMMTGNGPRSPGSGQLSPGLSQGLAQAQQRPATYRPRSSADGVGLTPPDEFGASRSRSASATRHAGRSPGRGPRDTTIEENGVVERKGVMSGSSATLGAMARKSSMPLR
ncbi:hypothetical protein HWV62_5478 [Athelia sp. TMB]|nr:hypothetical protein HWV62_5478 [Athelia sp. TMB]